ncbi:hypothetical protein F4859DRAFT_519538 [Xylaria cf. heliscus]|nr:hypothetical protein F4859DRAFT_519538 [Xylaria cf. heliscus]
MTENKSTADLYTTTFSASFYPGSTTTTPIWKLRKFNHHHKDTLDTNALELFIILMTCLFVTLFVGWCYQRRCFKGGEEKTLTESQSVGRGNAQVNSAPRDHEPGTEYEEIEYA